MSKCPVIDDQVGVDVVIPNYQYGRFLRDSVSSVLNQGLEKVRILIIDNASTDNSVEVAQQLAAEDQRVEVLARRRNLGPQASFNEGIDWAASPYFIVLCSDDLLAAGSLVRATSIMERFPEVGMAYGRSIYLYPQGSTPVQDASDDEASWQVMSGDRFLQRCCRTAMGQNDNCSTLVRTSAQKRVGYYRPELPFSDDFDMWLRFGCLGSVAATKAIQGVMRVHESSMTVVARQKQYDHEGDRLPLDLWRTKTAFEAFFANDDKLLPKTTADLQRLARQGLAERAYWSAFAKLIRGEAEVGWNLLKFSTKHQPTTVLCPPVGYLFARDGLGRRINAYAAEIMRSLKTPLTSAFGQGG